MMNAFITVNISDDPLSGFKRKVHVWGFQFLKDGISEGRIYTVCQYYENNNGEYGPEIDQKRFPPYDRPLLATNTNQVNPTNGLLVVKNINDQWEDPLGNIVETPMGQFDYFYQVLQSPINIPDFLTTIVQNEDNLYHTYNE